MNEKQKKVTELLGLQKYLVNFILFFYFTISHW